MPTKKIGDFKKIKICRDSEHNPPTMQLFEPGFYEHICPTCGSITHFTVPPRPTL